MATDDQAPWGRVDDDGTVYVREAEGERAVGQYPDATPEEALGYYQRKFTELAGQVTLLEQRVKRGASASDVTKAVEHLKEALTETSAVGDIALLRTRVAALDTTVVELTQQQSAEAQEAQAEAIVFRTALVVEAEELAAQDPARVQWKQITTQIDDIFARWQKHQQEGPRIPKGEGNELWKRFRAARSTIDAHRKAFYAELDAVHRDARQRKQALVEQAEALAPKAADGIPVYRNLLDDWKRAGRAGKKYDDALWAKFKAAGDVLYSAKSAIVAQDEVEYDDNLKAKLALLDEADPILTMTDRTQARDALISVQQRFDEIGRVPRDQVRPVEDRLRKVENHVRKLDDDFWQKNNPEKKARSEGLAGQLQDAIAKLESELEVARASGDQRAVKEAQEALDARRIWLDALGS
ncbi:MAG: ATPase [Frondihabitans sp.]|nr:ATPase [Frondihabitans sp.]